MTAVDPGVDLYRLLEIDPGASSAEITRAYRRLARRWHPDVATSPGAAHHFAKITHAYRVLSDPAARARYDTARATTTTAAPSRAGPTRRRRSSGRNSPWPPRVGQDASGGTPAAFWLGGPSFSHAFPTGTEPRPPDRDANVEGEVEVSVEEAYRGGCRTLTVTGPRGSTAVPLTIPPGVVTGQLLRVPIDALPSGHGAPPVTLRVRLAPHARYRINGRDVHTDLPLAPWEAALGTAATLQTPAAQVRLDVPAGTSTGAVLTAPGHGLPNPTGPAGELHAHIRVVVPPT
ncbi:MAG TPA: DnaJ C-terminal domain-containing protein [Segeticoccus sp.]|uniref:DnaJ C-terminal domain-containing protein n=1 Tax=Segeticoccus sp. TaxID=2706531 RepID=UPI002D7E8EBA|nr:DnaJ C-terminal domain-containing protein [Segeticoccus sp.]HET8600027.1 DnaJ C-terminal domain-containing protein [Segeticoccus sp.]